MGSFAKLIHRSHMTYLPTKMPVQFYGLPDGKVYILYPKFYRVGYDKSGLEFVIAEHEEFSYDYENNQLFSFDSSNKKIKVYNETVDKPSPKIKIIKVFRSIKSFSEAYQHLNDKAEKILKNNSQEEQQNPFEKRRDGRKSATA